MGRARRGIFVAKMTAWCGWDGRPINMGRSDPTIHGSDEWLGVRPIPTIRPIGYAALEKPSHSPVNSRQDSANSFLSWLMRPCDTSNLRATSWVRLPREKLGDAAIAAGELV